MAVMTDVREAAQNLIEYAIHRSMIGQDDRIWAYNTILECIGATGPALDMTWALKTEARLPRFPRLPLPTAPPRTRRRAATASPCASWVCLCRGLRL